LSQDRTEASRRGLDIALAGFAAIISWKMIRCSLTSPSRSSGAARSIASN
jgi:hypothetical protein